nr:hypothetical protein [Microbacterium hydrocarbonoxydans]
MVLDANANANANADADADADPDSVGTCCRYSGAAATTGAN